jgi:hypothetical protein
MAGSVPDASQVNNGIVELHYGMPAPELTVHQAGPDDARETLPARRNGAAQHHPGLSVVPRLPFPDSFTDSGSIPSRESPGVIHCPRSKASTGTSPRKVTSKHQLSTSPGDAEFSQGKPEKKEEATAGGATSEAKSLNLSQDKASSSNWQRPQHKRTDSNKENDTQSVNSISLDHKEANSTEHESFKPNKHAKKQTHEKTLHENGFSATKSTPTKREAIVRTERTQDVRPKNQGYNRALPPPEHSKEISNVATEINDNVNNVNTNEVVGKTLRLHQAYDNSTNESTVNAIHARPVSRGETIKDTQLHTRDRDNQEHPKSSAPVAETGPRPSQAPAREGLTTFITQVVSQSEPYQSSKPDRSSNVRTDLSQRPGKSDELTEQTTRKRASKFKRVQEGAHASQPIEMTCPSIRLQNTARHESLADSGQAILVSNRDEKGAPDHADLRGPSALTRPPHTKEPNRKPVHASLGRTQKSLANNQDQKNLKQGPGIRDEKTPNQSNKGVQRGPVNARPTSPRKTGDADRTKDLPTTKANQQMRPKELSDKAQKQ